MDELFKAVILPALLIVAACAVPLWIALKREEREAGRRRLEDEE